MFGNGHCVARKSHLIIHIPPSVYSVSPVRLPIVWYGRSNAWVTDDVLAKTSRSLSHYRSPPTRRLEDQECVQIWGWWFPFIHLYIDLRIPLISLNIHGKIILAYMIMMYGVVIANKYGPMQYLIHYSVAMNIHQTQIAGETWFHHFPISCLP